MTTTLKAEIDALKHLLMMGRAETDARIKELESRLAGEQEEKWPKDGDEYFYVSDCGDAGSIHWDGNEIDILRAALGNTFPTRTAAEQKAENERTIKMLADASGFVPDWGDYNQQKYELVWSTSGSCVDFMHMMSIRSVNGIYFKSIKEGQAAVDAIGVERVKALFGGGAS